MKSPAHSPLTAGTWRCCGGEAVQVEPMKSKLRLELSA